MDEHTRMMYRRLCNVHDIFQECGAADPLYETFSLIDLLLGGALSQTDMRALDRAEIDIPGFVKRREKRIPAQYIVGVASFMGRTFYCSPKTFIPKKQTELLCNVALDVLTTEGASRRQLTIIDMCTGCGNIAITLAAKAPRCTLHGVDVCSEAIEIAKRNVDLYGLGEKISLCCGDLFEPLREFNLAGRADLIVCNPPYIPTGSLQKLPSEIVDHEPRGAIDGGAFGLDFHRRLIRDSIALLSRKGRLIFEIAAGQEEWIDRFFRGKEEYGQIRYHGDGTEIRVVSAVRM